MEPFDLIIRGGLVYDGGGRDAYTADIAISAGRIVEVGDVKARAHEELDAEGLMVTPGFVDLHTHYDGQVMWEQRMSPSSAHGVTTVVMGNCGVGLAPCRPQDRARLMSLLEGVEDIPNEVMRAGLRWDWETFPDYMDVVGRQAYDVDMGVLFPHTPLRLYVMGERGANREPATSEDIRSMKRLAREAMEAGALGFATSRTLNHRATDGRLSPTLTAGEDELMAIASELQFAGRGVLQAVSDFTLAMDPSTEFNMWRRIVEGSGRPLFYTLQQKHGHAAAWRSLLSLTEKAQNDGVPISGQVLGRPSGVLLGLQLTRNPFGSCPSYIEISGLDLAARVAALQAPERRARILDEAAMDSRVQAQDWSRTFPLANPPDYEPPPEHSILARARQLGVRPEDVAFDEILLQEGHAVLLYAAQNYEDYSLEWSLDMLKSPATILGLGDGGAHYGLICDASVPTFMLTHWTRDRMRGERVPLAEVVRWLTFDTARGIGLTDRGLLAPGYKADLNIIDYQRLQLCAPEVVYDLPAKGRRVIQRAKGYIATIVSGQLTYREGVPTGALPGRLVRGPQSEPAF